MTLRKVIYCTTIKLKNLLKQNSLINCFFKKNCIINIDFTNALEIGINRRSWIMLLDFFGAYSHSKKSTNLSKNNYYGRR